MKFFKLTNLTLITLILSIVFHQSALARQESDFEKVGDVTMIAVPVTAAFIALWKGDKEGFFQLAEGQIYASGLTEALKHIVDAERPNGGRKSWPSGHVTAAAQGAAYLQFRYGWKYGLPAYAATAVVAASRVDADKHHWFDVASSVVLATGIQYVITIKKKSLTNIIIVPYLNGGKVGVQTAFRF